jgi:hypothetical protein
VNAHNSTTKENLITYYKTYKTIVLKKHVNATHAFIGKTLRIVVVHKW